MNFLLFLPIVLGSFLSEDDVKSKHLKQHVIRQFAPFIGSVKYGRTPSALRTLAKLYKPSYCTPRDGDSKEEKTKKVVCCYAHFLQKYTTDKFVLEWLKELDGQKVAEELNTAFEFTKRAKKQAGELEQLFLHAHDFELVATRQILREVLSKDEYRSFLAAQNNFHIERNGALAPFGYDLAVSWAQSEKVELESDDDELSFEEINEKETAKDERSSNEKNDRKIPSVLRLILWLVIGGFLLGAVFYVRFVFIPRFAENNATKISVKLESTSA